MNPNQLVDSLLNNGPIPSLAPAQQQKEVARVVKQWLSADDGEDADFSLRHSLLILGLIPKDAAEVYVERGAKEHGLVHVFIGADRCLEVLPDGTSSVLEL